jgi:hypothetical protein
MITLVLAIIFSVCNASVLPPGFIVRQFQSTRANVSTMKIEQRVVYSGITFNETMWFKGPDKFKAYVEKDGEALIFVRNGQKCSVMTSNSRVTVQDICKNISKNFYYSLLIPSGSFIGYLKAVGIKANYDQTEILKVNNEYVKPEDVFILRYEKDPVYLIGASEGEYSSALGDSKSDKKNITDRLVDNIKNKTPQAWFQTTTGYPVRIYGNYPDNSMSFELLMSSYSTDGNDFPFPTSIKLNINGVNSVSYGVKNFESNVGTIDDQIFNLAGYAAKFPNTMEESALNDNKKVLLNYLKEYR